MRADRQAVGLGGSAFFAFIADRSFPRVPNRSVPVLSFLASCRPVCEKELAYGTSGNRDVRHLTNFSATHAHCSRALTLAEDAPGPGHSLSRPLVHLRNLSRPVRRQHSCCSARATLSRSTAVAEEPC